MWLVRSPALGVLFAVTIQLVGCAQSSSTKVMPTVKQTAPVMTRDSSIPAHFARLRSEYGDRKDFIALCERDRPLRRFFELVDHKDWDQLVTVSESWLQQCPIDIDAHIVKSIALKALGRIPESEHHVRWFRGLVDSILASGDGRTPATAFVVISVAEEYSLLRVFGMRRTQQTLTSDRIDALSVVSDKGVPGVIYFNPAAHFRRLDDQLRKPR